MLFALDLRNIDKQLLNMITSTAVSPVLINPFNNLPIFIVVAFFHEGEVVRLKLTENKDLRPETIPIKLGREHNLFEVWEPDKVCLPRTSPALLNCLESYYLHAFF